MTWPRGGGARSCSVHCRVKTLRNERRWSSSYVRLESIWTKGPWTGCDCTRQMYKLASDSWGSLPLLSPPEFHSVLSTKYSHQVDFFERTPLAFQRWNNWAVTALLGVFPNHHRLVQFCEDPADCHCVFKSSVIEKLPLMSSTNWPIFRSLPLPISVSACLSLIPPSVCVCLSCFSALLCQRSASSYNCFHAWRSVK